MKVGNFVQFTIDVQDLLSNFVGVKTTDQMVSALEKMKRTGAEGFLETINSLQSSFDSLMADDIETPSADEIDSLFASSEGSGGEVVAEGESAAERLGLTSPEMGGGQ